MEQGQIASIQKQRGFIKRTPRGKTNFNPYQIDSIMKMNDVIGLAKYGARPAIIAALTCIPHPLASRLYKETIEKKPPHGIIPTCTHKNMRSPSFRIEASMFLQVYGHFLRNGLSKTQALIRSYDIYSTNFDFKNKLCINRCYNLIRLVDTNQASINSCKPCNIDYVVMNDQIINNGRQCPLCHQMHSYHLKSSTKKV